MERDPCPFRIVMDCGGAYTIGFVGGSLWHGIKGLRMNPKVRPLPRQERLHATPRPGDDADVDAGHEDTWSTGGHQGEGADHGR